MNVIKKIVEGVSAEWDLFIYSVQLSIIDKVSKRLGTAPFNIMFGRRLNDFKIMKKKTDQTSNLTAEKVFPKQIKPSL